MISGRLLIFLLPWFALGRLRSKIVRNEGKTGRHKTDSGRTTAVGANATNTSDSTEGGLFLNQTIGCTHGWKKLRDKYTTNSKRWKSHSPSCYNMSITLGSWGYTNVIVQNDTVIGQDSNGGPYPTMNEIYSDLFKYCIEGCPNVGPTSCIAKFAKVKQGSYITWLYINIANQLGSLELTYNVKALTMCSE